MGRELAGVGRPVRVQENERTAGDSWGRLSD